MADERRARVRFTHERPPEPPVLEDVTDRAAGLVSVFDPERVGRDDDGHWLQIDSRFAITAEEAR